MWIQRQHRVLYHQASESNFRFQYQHSKYVIIFITAIIIKARRRRQTIYYINWNFEFCDVMAKERASY